MPTIERDLTPGEQERADKLVELATAEFGDLSEADEFVVRCTAVGVEADFRVDEVRHELLRLLLERSYVESSKINASRNRAEFKGAVCSPSRAPVTYAEVTARVVEWLLVDSDAASYMRSRAVVIGGAIILEKVCLQHSKAIDLLALAECVLAQGLDLSGARVGRLILSGSQLRATNDPDHEVLIANGACFDRDVFLDAGFCAIGEVSFNAARIGANLSLAEGHFIGERQGVDLDGAVIDGGLFLRRLGAMEGILNLTRARASCICDRSQWEEEEGQWPSRLLLTGMSYDSIHPQSDLNVNSRLEWLGHHDETCEREFGFDLPPDPQPYRQLADVMRKQGHEADARKVMETLGWRRRKLLAVRIREAPVGQVAQRVTLSLLIAAVVAIPAIAGPWWAGLIGLAVGVGVYWRVRKWHPLEWWMQQSAYWVHRTCTKFYGLMFGFGYARWYALVWIAGFILIGAGTFGLGNGTMMQPAQPLALKNWDQAILIGMTPSPEDPQAFMDEMPEGLAALQALAALPELGWVGDYPAFNSIVYSADAFLPLVSFHQEEYWTPSGKGWNGWGWFVKNVYLPFHIVMGWVIATLFVASFTRLMRHQD